MNRTASVIAFALVLTLFAVAVVTYVLALAGNRSIGALLLACGGIAAFAARYVAEGHRVVRQRISLLGQPRGIVGPLTVVLCGSGIAALGALFMLEV